MDSSFAQGVSTLHGLYKEGFPNLFFSGVAQASLSGNVLYNADVFAKHVAYVLQGAQQKGGDSPLIEPTKAAEAAWGDQVAANSLGLAGMGGCTPSYLNAEGALNKLADAPPEIQAAVARGQIWGRGVNHYVSALSLAMCDLLNCCLDRYARGLEEGGKSSGHPDIRSGLNCAWIDSFIIELEKPVTTNER
jgi:hypothetical protein